MHVLSELLKQRKWYNAYMYLQSCDEESIAPEVVDLFLKTILPIASQMHPLSLASTMIYVTKKHAHRYDILIELQNRIKDSVLKTDEHKLAVDLIRIVLADIKLDNGYNIEEDIYEFKNMKLTHEQENHFNVLALKYFEKIQNYDEAYTYARKVNDTEKMIKYSVLAPNMFNLPSFENESEYFKAVREGNFKYIKNCKMDNYDFVLQKTYIIKILSLCHDKTEISIATLSTELELERIIVLKLIIKALGLKLIKGKIDGANDILMITHVSMQSTTRDELLYLRNQFIKWKARVDKVIAIME